MDYAIHTDIKYGPLQLVDAGKLAAECSEKWWNQTLCQVNDSVVRLGVFEGEFHWHKHDREDEFFYVVEGKLLIDFESTAKVEGRTVELGPRQGMMVPQGVMHRTRAQQRTVALIIEPAATVARGD